MAGAGGAPPAAGGVVPVSGQAFVNTDRVDGFPGNFILNDALHKVGLENGFIEDIITRSKRIKRWISLVLPPLTDRREIRSVPEPGSIAYSAVTQPFPVSRIHGGTSSSSETVQRTRVRPISIKTEPGVISVKPRVIFTARSSSSVR